MREDAWSLVHKIFGVQGEKENKLNLTTSSDGEEGNRGETPTFAE